MENAGQDSLTEERLRELFGKKRMILEWRCSHTGMALCWYFISHTDLHAARRPARSAADETDGRVPTSRLSNKTSSTRTAQIGAKTDPKPFTTEDVLLCITITMLAWRYWLTYSNCARPTQPAHVVFSSEAILKIISFEITGDRMNGPGS
jgi:hypothetical protein